MPEVPALITDRLTLRGYRLDDFDDCYALWSDPEVMRYISSRPFTREEVWARLLRYVGHWTLLGYGYWIVHETATGAFVGDVGFADHRRDLTPSFGGAPEAGWVLAAAAQGRGLCTEAMQAVLAWGETRFDEGRTVCLIDPRNTASQRVAAKIGYREFARTTYKDQPVILFER